jgi:hypothetical protein
MYGLINNSPAGYDHLVVRRRQMARSAPQTPGCRRMRILTMRHYDDQITYQLAGAASEVLGAPVDDCMEMFGNYWVEARWRRRTSRR